MPADGAQYHHYIEFEPGTQPADYELLPEIRSRVSLPGVEIVLTHNQGTPRFMVGYNIVAPLPLQPAVEAMLRQAVKDIKAQKGWKVKGQHARVPTAQEGRIRWEDVPFAGKDEGME